MILFFIATSAANNANNAKALPLLTGFSLLTGFTLSGIVALAIGTIGIGSVGTAALATGITFVIASYTGQRITHSLASVRGNNEVIPVAKAAVPTEPIPIVPIAKATIPLR